MRIQGMRWIVLLSTFVGCGIILCAILRRPELLTLLKRVCTPHHQVAFIKLHKVGGTTVQNVLQRFGEKNKLMAALPKKRNVLSKNFRNVVKIPKLLTFNLLYSHAEQFNRDSLNNVMPGDTIYFTIVREPLAQFVSSFYYYKTFWRLPYLEEIPEEKNPLEEYLLNPGKYEPLSAALSYTNNRMSFDLGLAEKQFRSKSAIESWLRDLDTQIDFILITEHFNQSLIMLKRRFCWGLRDILYVYKNVNMRKPKVKISPQMLQMFQNLFMADIMLYNYSYHRFRESLKQQSPDFDEEVAVFEGMLNQVDKYCSASYMPAVLLLPNHTFERTNFSPSFELTPWDCEMMYLREIQFAKRTRKKQKDILFMKDLEEEDYETYMYK